MKTGFKMVKNSLLFTLCKPQNVLCKYRTRCVGSFCYIVVAYIGLRRLSFRAIDNRFREYLGNVMVRTRAKNHLTQWTLLGAPLICTATPCSALPLASQRGRCRRQYRHRALWKIYYLCVEVCVCRLCKNNGLGGTQVLVVLCDARAFERSKNRRTTGRLRRTKSRIDGAAPKIKHTTAMNTISHPRQKKKKYKNADTTTELDQNWLSKLTRTRNLSSTIMERCLDNVS